MSRTDEAFLQRAMKIATTSTCRQRHGAVIVKSGRVLSVGVNRDRNHPSNCSNPAADASYHAEIAAINILSNRDLDTNRATIYIARVGRNGKPANSRPCNSCMGKLLLNGIKKVVYTI